MDMEMRWIYHSWWYGYGITPYLPNNTLYLHLLNYQPISAWLQQHPLQMHSSPTSPNFIKTTFSSMISLNSIIRNFTASANTLPQLTFFPIYLHYAKYINANAYAITINPSSLRAHHQLINSPRNSSTSSKTSTMPIKYYRRLSTLSRW